jgi:hypothetical protein
LLVSGAWRRIRKISQDSLASLRCMEKDKETEVRIYLLVSGADRMIRKWKRLYLLVSCALRRIGK